MIRPPLTLLSRYNLPGQSESECRLEISISVRERPAPASLTKAIPALLALRADLDVPGEVYSAGNDACTVSMHGTLKSPLEPFRPKSDMAASRTDKDTW